MATSATKVLPIVNTTMTGAEIEIVVPAGFKSMFLHANGGEVTISTESGGDVLTIVEYVHPLIICPDLAGRSIYATGDAGVILEIMYSITLQED